MPEPKEPVQASCDLPASVGEEPKSCGTREKRVELDSSIDDSREEADIVTEKVQSCSDGQKSVPVTSIKIDTSGPRFVFAIMVRYSIT